MSKGKKIALAVVALVLAAACVAGVVLVPKLMPQEPVKVYSYDMVGYESFYYGGTESYGMVTTDRVQAVYVTETQNITEIMVYSGQQVKKGDVLYTYDTTLTDLALERKDLSIQQLEANLKTAQKELTELKKLKPMVIPDEPTASATNKSPSSADMEGKIYNASSASGTQNKPYRVWLKTTTQVTDEMILEYVAQKNEEYKYEVFVVFGIASAPNKEYTSEYGVRYQVVKEEVPVETEEPTEEPTEPAETTEPTEPAESTEATEPTDPSEPGDPSDPSEPTEETTEPTEPETTEPEPTEPETETVLTLKMRFFTPSTVNDDDIEYNSGYTSSELTAMKADKQTEIDELKFQIKIAKAELNIMKQESETGEVKAEFAGTVASVLTPSDALAMNQPMIKVMGGGGFYVEGSVSELDLETVQVGQSVTVTSWDTYMTYEGTIQSVGSYPTENAGYSYYGSSNMSYYPYTVFIDETADLQEGMYVSMTYQPQIPEEVPAETEPSMEESVPSEETEPSEETLPEEGLFPEELPQEESGVLYLENAFILQEKGRYYVFARGTDGLLEKREIQVGENDGYSTVILGGVTMEDYLAFPYGRDCVEGAPTVEGTWEDLYGY